jgi:CubicO group peptidase (beta-lactamase class C family)
VDTTLERGTLFEWALGQDKYYGGYQYSNIGYVMATSMLEKAAGKPWQAILEERIFTPLKIDARYGWPAIHDTTDTWGHLEDPETKEFMAHTPDDLYDLKRLKLGPAGNLSLSIPNFVKFLQDNLNGWNGKRSLLNSESYQLMHNGKEYGLGWGIVEVINEDYYNVSIHSGSAGTFYSKAILFKDEDFGVVLCMNRFVEDNNDLVIPLVNDILDTYRPK